MADEQPTQADRAVYDCVIDWHKDGHTAVGLGAIARHAREAADAREAEVVAGVVAIVDSFERAANEAAYDCRQAGRDDNFWCAQASAGANIARALRRGDWKGQSA